MDKVVSKKVKFYKVITKKRKSINFKILKKLYILKNSVWNWLTGRTHAVVPGRVHIFLKNRVGKYRYSFKIKNGQFETLPLSFIKLLADEYRNY